MKKDVSLNFNIGMGQGFSRYANDVQIVNCFPVSTPGERSTTKLVTIPGGAKLATLSPSVGTGCRGLWTASTGPASNGFVSTMYGVFGNSLFRIKADGTGVFIGNLQNSMAYCSFAENQDQTSSGTMGFVCDGVTVYTWDLKAENSAVASTYKEAVLPYVNGSETERAIAKYISYNAYRLVLTCGNSVQWYFSEINSSEFKSSSFESSESSPDQTVRVISHGGNLWVLGAYSYDIFSPTFDANDPYSVGSGATGRIGCANGDSVAQVGDLLFWLGQGDASTNAVYMADRAGAITEITTPGIKNIIASWAYKSYAKGFAYNDQGRSFFVLTSALDKCTLVFDSATGLWHRRSSSANGTLDYWDVASVRACYGAIFYATSDSNSVNRFRYDVIQDQEGRPITRMWQSPVFFESGDYQRILEVRLDVETGAYPSSEAHKAYLQTVWDGRSGDRLLRSLGAPGDNKKQVSFLSCGAGRNLVLRIGTSSPAPVIFYSIRLVIDSSGRTA